MIGQGSIGLLFSHALKARGAAWVTGVDRVDRSDVAAAFGVDEVVWNDAAAWARDREAASDIVVEAVGHHAGPLEAAVTALAPHGTVLAFGVPDETHYAFPFMAFFRKHATLIAGAATDRAQRARAAPATTCASTARCWSPTSRRARRARGPDRVRDRVSPTAGRLKVVLRGLTAEGLFGRDRDQHVVAVVAVGGRFDPEPHRRIDAFARACRRGAAGTARCDRAGPPAGGSGGASAVTSRWTRAICGGRVLAPARGAPGLDLARRRRSASNRGCRGARADVVRMRRPSRSGR